MTWFYEIRDASQVVAATRNGFDTNKSAMAAGRKKARELKASGSLPGGGTATVKALEDLAVLVPEGAEKISFDEVLIAAKVDKK
jgi:hypothetical protein